MKYLQIFPGEYIAVAPGSEMHKTLMAVPKDQRMLLLPESNPGVKAWL